MGGKTADTMFYKHQITEITSNPKQECPLPHILYGQVPQNLGSVFICSYDFLATLKFLGDMQ